MDNKIKWGILSTGHIALKFAQALKFLPGAELFAVASRNMDTAQAFATENGIEKAYGTYEDLAQDPEIDVIYIGTPHTFHLENSLLCMNNGKSVLCEKAFTINAAEARIMVQTAREKNVFLMEAMIPRHIPVLKKAVEWVKEGRIGDIRMVRASRCARRDFPPEARQLNPDLGGGSLLDVGVYVISFAYQIFGKQPVQSSGLSHIGKYHSDEQGAAILKYDKGEIADLSFALRTEAVDEAYIFGTDGYIKINDPFAISTKASLFIDCKKVEIVEEPIIGSPLKYEAEEVIRCLKLGLKESPLMPLEESVQIMETMDEIRKPWDLLYENDTRLF